MTKSDSDSEELRHFIRAEYADQRRLGELVSGLKVHSKTKVSQWLNGKYPGDTKKWERDIRQSLKRGMLSRNDERPVTKIKGILNDAANCNALIAEITASAQ